MKENLSLILIACSSEAETPDSASDQTPTDIDAIRQLDPELRAIAAQIRPLQPFWRVINGQSPHGLSLLAHYIAGPRHPIYPMPQLDEQSVSNLQRHAREALQDIVGAWITNGTPTSHIVVIGHQPIIEAIAQQATAPDTPVWKTDFLMLQIPWQRANDIYYSSRPPQPLPPQ